MTGGMLMRVLAVLLVLIAVARAPAIQAQTEANQPQAHQCGAMGAEITGALDVQSESQENQCGAQGESQENQVGEQGESQEHQQGMESESQENQIED